MLPIDMDLETYNLIKEWVTKCNAYAAIDIDSSNNVIEIYTDKPGQMIGPKGSLFSKYEYALRQHRVWRDYSFAIYEVGIFITPDSPKITQEEYDKDWEEHMNFRFGDLYDPYDVDC